MLLETTDETAKSRKMMSNEPRKAPMTTAREPMNWKPPPSPPVEGRLSMPPRMSITSATPTLAPLVMPSIDGPARGLRKAVCNSKPDTARLAPHSIAVMLCGTRDSITM